MVLNAPGLRVEKGIEPVGKASLVAVLPVLAAPQGKRHLFAINHLITMQLRNLNPYYFGNIISGDKGCQEEQTSNL